MQGSESARGDFVNGLAMPIRFSRGQDVIEPECLSGNILNPLSHLVASVRKRPVFIQ
jgi:hypothetical protein